MANLALTFSPFSIAGSHLGESLITRSTSFERISWGDFKILEKVTEPSFSMKNSAITLPPIPCENASLGYSICSCTQYCKVATLKFWHSVWLLRRSVVGCFNLLHNLFYIYATVGCDCIVWPYDEKYTDGKYCSYTSYAQRIEP